MVVPGLCTRTEEDNLTAENLTAENAKNAEERGTAEYAKYAEYVAAGQLNARGKGQPTQGRSEQSRGSVFLTCGFPVRAWLRRLVFITSPCMGRQNVSVDRQNVSVGLKSLGRAEWLQWRIAAGRGVSGMLECVGVVLLSNEEFGVESL